MPFRLLFHYVVILYGVTYRSKKRTGETLVSSSLALPGRASLPQNEKSLNANAKGMGWKIYGLYGLRSNVPSMRIEY